MKNKIPFLLFAAAIPGMLAAQTGSVDPGFNTGTGANNTVRAFLVQPDGNVVMSGAHSLYNGSSANTIVRLDVYGAVDPGFSAGTGANNYISAMALQPDGKILIGGAFTSYDGIGRNYIARINANGTLDASFNPGSGANQRVEAIVVQPDGKILIGGVFQNFNGSGRNRIARLNANGTVDTGFVPGTGANQNVEALALQSDGKVLVGGSFTSFNGTALNRIARLNSDGSLDMTFTPGTGASATIWDMALQPDGKLVVGGEFTTFNGTARGRIARLNTNGSLDLTFATGSGLSAVCRRLEMHGGGKVLVAGNFTSANGVGRNRIARLNADGSTDLTFNPGMGLNNGEAWALAARPDGRVLLGGSFTLFNSTAKNRVVQLLGDDCPLLGVNIGDACDDGDPNTVGDVYNPQCTCLGTCNGNQVVLQITTDGYADQIGWQFTDDANNQVAAGSLTNADNNSFMSRTICLDAVDIGDACYGFRIFDSFGDGITGGGWELRNTGGKLLLRDNFATGSQSPANPTASASYGSSHSFCLPAGPSRIMANECNVFTNGMYDKVYCSKVTGATQYQFEFSNPDAGYMRRIARPHNYVVFYEMVSSPLVPGVVYFTRARTNEQGPLASAHWGSGCDLGLGIAQVVQCTQLIQAPAYGHSCNETRSFTAPYNYLYAKPVTGATTYTFKITGDDGNYNSGIEFVRNTYILALGWGTGEAPALTDQTTYQVQVRVTVNGIEGTYCGNACDVTIDNNPNLGEQVLPTSGNASLWPNPVRDGLVNMDIQGLQRADQHIAVDIRDIYGKQVFAQEFSNSGEHFSTILQLPKDIATGVYMVNITVNGQRSVQRLSIIR